MVTPLLYIDIFLDLLAFDVFDFGTNFPNASKFGAFADVVAEKFLLLLIVLTDDVFVGRWTVTNAIITRPTSI